MKYKNLNHAQVSMIPELRTKYKMRPSEIARRFGVTPLTIRNWEKKLSKAGYVIPLAPMGRPPMDLSPNKESSEN